MYIITDGEKYLHKTNRDQICEILSYVNAKKTWDKEKTCYNVISQFKKSGKLCKKFNVNASQLKVLNLEKQDEHEELSGKKYSLNDTSDSAEECSLDIDVDSIVESFNVVVESYDSIINRIDFLRNNLSLVDRQINDILHKIEEGRFSGVGGFKLAKGIQLARNERRKIKNELVKLEYIKKINLNSNDIYCLKKTHDKIVENKNPIYYPRELHELFE